MPWMEAYKIGRLLLKQGRKYVFLVLLFVAFIYGLPEKTEASVMPTTLRVFPSRVVVEAVNTTIPTSPITVKIAVLNVIDLFAWQIKLYFNATMLNLTTDGVWYPSGHVFADRVFIPVSAVVSSDEKGFFIAFGASLLGEESSFSGSGVLCQMNFTRIAEGASALSFSKPFSKDTFLLDTGGEQILFMVFDGGVNSAMSIIVNPTETIVERYITVSGNINPTMKNVNLTIFFRLAGGAWNTLANVTTDMNGDFSHTWRPTRAGTYEIRASWSGDENVNSAVSETEIVTVRPLVNVAPLVIAVLAVSIIVLILIYIIKFRKR